MAVDSARTCSPTVRSSDGHPLHDHTLERGHPIIDGADHRGLIEGDADGVAVGADGTDRRHPVLDQAVQGVGVGADQLGQSTDACLHERLDPGPELFLLAPVHPDLLLDELELAREIGGLLLDDAAHGLVDVEVLRHEGLGMLLDALREVTHRLGTALHVALHGLHDTRGLAGDQLAVVPDLLEHRLGEVAVPLIHVGERFGDVELDLLELRTDGLHAVDRR